MPEKKSNHRKDNSEKTQKSKDKSHSEPSKSEHQGEHSLFLGSKKAVLGGLIAGVVALIGQYLVGQVYSGWEARRLLESVMSSALYFSSSVVTAAATILALMLTMLGLTSNAATEFDSIFYKRIQRIGLLTTICLIAGILLLLFLSIPVQESDQVPPSWFKIIYYVLISFISGLSGLVVGIVLMLLNSINGLIKVVSPSADEDEENAEEREDQESEEEKEEIDEDEESSR